MELHLAPHNPLSDRFVIQGVTETIVIVVKNSLFINPLAPSRSICSPDFRSSRKFLFTSVEKE